MVSAAIGLGSNVGDSPGNVRAAIQEIARLGRLVAVSQLYFSPAWGYEDQPDFCNAVLMIEVNLSALDLLHELKKIEVKLGRVPTFKWGPRVIDLDVLLFGDQKISCDELVVPHPFMHERAFVMLPLAEIDSRFTEMLSRIPEQERLKCTPTAGRMPLGTYSVALRNSAPAGKSR